MRNPGALIHVFEANAGGQTSGLEIVSGGGGIFLTYLKVDAALSYGVEIVDAVVLDTNLAVRAPTFKFGNGPLSSVIRSGKDSLGGLPSIATAWILAETVNVVPSSSPYFIPPGRILLVRRNTVNTTALVQVGFLELPAQ